jgi:hypothetical protein
VFKAVSSDSHVDICSTIPKSLYSLFNVKILLSRSATDVSRYISHRWQKTISLSSFVFGGNNWDDEEHPKCQSKCTVSTGWFALRRLRSNSLPLITKLGYYPALARVPGSANSFSPCSWLKYFPVALRFQTKENQFHHLLQPHCLHIYWGIYLHNSLFFMVPLIATVFCIINS